MVLNGPAKMVDGQTTIAHHSSLMLDMSVTRRVGILDIHTIVLIFIGAFSLGSAVGCTAGTTAVGECGPKTVLLPGWDGSCSNESAFAAGAMCKGVPCAQSVWA